MKKLPALAYSLVCYLIFVGIFLYAIGFVGDFAVPKTINSGPGDSLLAALLVDGGLIILFGIQHTLMARASFKAQWTKVVPRAVERSTYVLVTSLVLGLLFWQWRPLPQTVWEMPAGFAYGAVTLLGLIGWAVTLLASFLIDHFHLFGLRQPYDQLRDKPLSAVRFRSPFFYRVVRHPMMTGIVIAFWITPYMTLGRLVFALGMTTYIMIGIRFEERDLMSTFGETYEYYRRRTPMLLPVPPLATRRNSTYPLARDMGVTREAE